MAVVAFDAAFAAYILNAVAHGRGIGDWPSMFTAGELVRTGRLDELYRPAAQLAVQRQAFDSGAPLNAFPLPAFVAVLLAPLAALGYRASFALWLVCNLAIAGALAFVAWQYLSALPRDARLLFVGAAACSLPVLNTLLFGQFDLLVLAAIAGAYACLRRDHRAVAGLLLTAAMVKPQLVVGVLLLLLARREWRVLAWCLAASCALAAIPVLAAGPRIIADQARLLSGYNNAGAAFSVHEEMMINARGVITSVAGGAHPVSWMLALAAVGAVSVTVAVRRWPRAATTVDERAWALALLLPLLCMPHVHMQSAVLAVAALALLLRDRADRGLEHHAGLFAAACLALTPLWLINAGGGPSLSALLVGGVFVVAAAAPARVSAASEEAMPLPRAA